MIQYHSVPVLSQLSLFDSLPCLDHLRANFLPNKLFFQLLDICHCTSKNWQESCCDKISLGFNGL